MSKVVEITKALADLDEERTLQLVGEALAEQVPAGDILQACQEGMNQVGARFECQDYFVSDLIMSGEIFKQVGAILEPQSESRRNGVSGEGRGGHGERRHSRYRQGHCREHAEIGGF